MSPLAVRLSFALRSGFMQSQLAADKNIAGSPELLVLIEKIIAHEPDVPAIKSDAPKPI